MMEDNALYHIVIVEDVRSILWAIKDYLISETNYNILVAENCEEAEKILFEYKANKRLIHLLVTDIHLPDGLGLSLVNTYKTHMPHVQVALITSYDINNYINYVYKHQIDQVISKQSDMNLKYIKVTIDKLLSKRIFGVQHYFSDIQILSPQESPKYLYGFHSLHNKILYTKEIRSSRERSKWVNKIGKQLAMCSNFSEASVVLTLEEISLNAMIHAPRNKDKTMKYARKMYKHFFPHTKHLTLERSDYFYLQYGYYDNWVIIACLDLQGNLTKQDILYRLNRHISVDHSTNVPYGLMDTHGRAFLLLRESLTKLIINIQKNQKSEIICLYNTSQNTVYKDISIFEIE